MPLRNSARRLSRRLARQAQYDAELSTYYANSAQDNALLAYHYNGQACQKPGQHCSRAKTCCKGSCDVSNGDGTYNCSAKYYAAGHYADPLRWT